MNCLILTLYPDLTWYDCEELSCLESRPAFMISILREITCRTLLIQPLCIKESFSLLIRQVARAVLPEQLNSVTCNHKRTHKQQENMLLRHII